MEASTMDMVPQATVDIARSLWIIYQQLPGDAQRAFKEMITNDEYASAEWLSLSALSLKDIWETPEEDYWDELYAKQHPAR